MKQVFGVLIILIPAILYGQRTSINYELNGRPSNAAIQDYAQRTQNPFAKFIGEWTLKNDTWIHNWGNGTDTLKIPGHHTVSSQINTENSLFSIIDGPEPNGHIFWSYNPNTKEVGHLSSFGTIRVGTGKGAFYGEDNVRLKIQFEGEGPGTYRVYTYEWINDDEYALNSIQYDENDKPTGLFYRGNFVRLTPNQGIETEITEILRVLDDPDLPKEQQIAVYAEDVTHMAPNNEVITNRSDLLTYLKRQKEYGHSKMEHQIEEISSHGDVILMRGKVEGTFYPSSGDADVNFQTKNFFVFTRVDGKLKISKVIYNLTSSN